jgi:aryl-alcohol dehydrogenase-like predicted oxidoreductase
MGWSQFVALQVEYSLLQRTPERELIPMANHFGMTVTPWAPLAGGALTGKYLKGEKGRLPDTSKRLNANSTRITQEVINIAQELNVEPAHVALRWTMQQGFKCIPVIGATKVDQVAQNLACLNINLEQTHLNRLQEASKIELGFPGDFFLEEGVKTVTFGGFYDKIIKR